jgi:hypothetical protein
MAEHMKIRHRAERRAVVFLLGFLFVLAAMQSAKAQKTAQLTVSLTVTPSIQLVFQNSSSVGSPGYCPLTNAGTNNVGLDLGSAWILGIQSSPCAGYSSLNGGLAYQVSSGYNVVVTKANSSSASYTLSAAISSAPPSGVTWLINNNALSNTAYTTLSTAGSYGAANAQTLQAQVVWSAAAGTLQETVTYLATAN